MRLLSWNVNGRRGTALERQVAAVTSRRPDLVALQEVRIESLDAWRTGLGAAGLVHLVDSATDLSVAAPAGAEYRRRYFNLIASRWSLERLPGLAIAYPERYLACSIRVSALELELHVAHIPPGASRGLIKVEMFEALYRRLATRSERPRILCGDFNTPRFESPDGTVGFWGLRHRPHMERWDVAESSVILGLAEHDLRDVFRSLNGYSAQDASWIVKRRGEHWRRRYDHIFAAESLRPVRCSYVHSWRETRLSDHSAIEADLEAPLAT